MFRLFVDIESTGNGSDRYHDIVEINALLYDEAELKSTFDAKFSPNEKTKYQEGIGYKKMLANKKNKDIDSRDGFKLFYKWLKDNLGKHKALLIAYNCLWDEKHLKNWFWKNDERFSDLFFNPCVCTMASCTLITGNELFVSLKDCARSLSIPVDPKLMHTARYDNEINQKIYEELRLRINQ